MQFTIYTYKFNDFFEEKKKKKLYDVTLADRIQF